MTRQHFEAIARAVSSSPLSTTDRMVVASHLASELVAFNPRFEAGRFIRACIGEAGAE